MATSNLENDSSWTTDLFDFCCEICDYKEEKEEMGETDTSEKDEGVTCFYCGKQVEERESAKNGAEEPMCEECQRRMLTDIVKCQKLVDKVQKNVSELFNVRLEKDFVVEKGNGIWKQIGRVLSGKGKAEKEETSEVLVRDTDKGYYQIFIKKDLPDAVITANIVYFLCYKFFCAKYENEDADLLAGLAQWFKVHYLYLLDLKDYAGMDDKKAENNIKLKESYGLWKEALNSPSCSQVVWLGKIDESIKEVKEKLVQSTMEQGHEDMEEESREEADQENIK